MKDFTSAHKIDIHRLFRLQNFTHKNQIENIRKKVILFLGLSLSTIIIAEAQTITLNSITPNPICHGSDISVNFIISDHFDNLTIQLSDISGGFVSPANIGSYQASDAGTYTATATIPFAIPGGNNYKIRVISTSPSANSNEYSIIINNPLAPTGSLTQDFCAINNPTVANLTATGSDIKWYSVASGGTALQTTSPLNTSTTYFASQTVDGCESSIRLAVAVTVFPVFDPGKIRSTGEIICYNTDPGVIGSEIDPFGGNSIYTYRWRKDGVIIEGAILATYDPPTLTSSATYTREVMDGFCNNNFNHYCPTK